MKYKALILDVDGTLIPKRHYGIPSKKLIETIRRARKLIHIGLATSRPLSYLTNILDRIEFSGPSIISGGAQIIDFPSQKIIWEKHLEIEDVKKLGKELKKFKGNRIYLNDGSKDFLYKWNNVNGKLMEIYVAGFTMEEADNVVDKLTSISTHTAIHKVPSWQEGKTDIIATHALATKQHGIFEVAKILDINTHEIIAVGDGYNDFPLLMACGLKVAMGNAVDELKAIADYIAPTVEEDGVADVIEKFVLN